ncbi:MAG: diaminopimelate epimerase [Bacteroidetes bacterium GWE2_29_8]|nr:MAG: diaminopimelate epimerase [Bacteroidetes bacterium GWE2_29_8]OFY14625.1 MAG: diaminopimelate epimerase [Bacteroidetes bacterium GWF2_29_10]
MQDVKFFKYHGTGNDFILIDNRNSLIKITEKEVRFLCNRHLGIGADGFIILENSSDYDFKMRYFNSDGKEATMCGNGARCIISFAFDIGIVKSNYLFEAIDGLHEASIVTSINNIKEICLKMQDVKEINLVGKNYLLNTGSPHLVVFNEDIEEINVNSEGSKLRNSAMFKQNGVNVNFVKEQGRKLYVRTFERGVEAETLSCGTGVVASVIAFHKKHGVSDGEYSTHIKTFGGNLNVRFYSVESKYQNIFLSGDTTFVFSGLISL